MKYIAIAFAATILLFGLGMIHAEPEEEIFYKVEDITVRYNNPAYQYDQERNHILLIDSEFPGEVATTFTEFTVLQDDGDYFIAIDSVTGAFITVQKRKLMVASLTEKSGVQGR